MPREPIPQPVRQTQDPLSDGDIWDDMVHQMRGTFGHAATTAARTQRTALARERDEPVEAAVAAAKPREPPSQESAPEEVPKRALDEWRQAVAVAQPRRLGQEGLEVILHDLVKDAAGGATRFVARGRPGHSARKAEGVPTSQPPGQSALDEEGGTQDLFARFAADLAFYREGRWPHAAAAFASALEIDPLDDPALTLHARSIAYLAAAPAAWDGVSCRGNGIQPACDRLVIETEICGPRRRRRRA
jgi:hypothetical protein